MPEGPSIVILKELVQPFKGKEIINAEGNSKLDIQLIAGQIITDFKSWGKHFLICLPAFSVRIHFMLFGSYLINEQKAMEPRLSLQFEDGEINFYACSVQFLTKNLDEVYDWSGDIMNEAWDPEKAKIKLSAQPETLVCDALLNQDIFAGAGNIIKNEVLFRIRVHPESQVGGLPEILLEEMIAEARIYSFEFLEWKKNFVLKKHWLAHTKKICPRCHIPFDKKYAGKSKRRSYFCINCQILYSSFTKDII